MPRTMSRATLSGDATSALGSGMPAVIGVATIPGLIVTTLTPVPCRLARKSVAIGADGGLRGAVVEIRGAPPVAGDGGDDRKRAVSLLSQVSGCKGRQRDGRGGVDVELACRFSRVFSALPFVGQDAVCDQDDVAALRGTPKALEMVLSWLLLIQNIQICSK
jgi:hypothetical protein